MPHAAVTCSCLMELHPAAVGYNKSCFCDTARPGGLDCSIRSGTRYPIARCPDGKVTGNGFYARWSDDTEQTGGCIKYSHVGDIANYVNCIYLNDTPGEEDYVCSKLLVGHANYAAANMGFLLGKRVRCQRAEFGFQCSTYKVHTQFFFL